MNNGTSFGYPMTSDSSAYYCNVHPDGKYTCNYTYVYRSSAGLYEDFVNSLSDTSYNKHTEDDINIAISFYRNYLSEDELVAEQKSGRFWTIDRTRSDTKLVILLDDENVLFVSFFHTEPIIEDRNTAIIPEEIKYKKYKGDEQ